LHNREPPLATVSIEIHRRSNYFGKLSKLINGRFRAFLAISHHRPPFSRTA